MGEIMNCIWCEEKLSELEKFLNEMKERADKATKGQWKKVYSVNYNGDDGGYSCVKILQKYRGMSVDATKYDLDFIAHSRNDIEKLLKIVGVLRGALKSVSGKGTAIASEALSEADEIAGEE